MRLNAKGGGGGGDEEDDGEDMGLEMIGGLLVLSGVFGGESFNIAQQRTCLPLEFGKLQC